MIGVLQGCVALADIDFAVLVGELDRRRRYARDRAVAALVAALVRPQGLYAAVAHHQRLAGGLEDPGDRLDPIPVIAVVGDVGVLLDRLSDRSVEVEGIRGALRDKPGDAVDLRDSDSSPLPGSTQG